MSGMGREASGYQPEPHYDQQHSYQRQDAQSGPSTMAAVAQLFARLSQEIEEQKPKNCIHFVVDFLCKHYPEHLHGFASIWQMDPDLERERHEVVNFFKAHKISTAVAAHFTNAGYDTLDTLTTLNKESLVDVEAFNNVKWLPGHKVRLQQIFGEIAARVRAYRQQYGNTGSSRAKTSVVSAPTYTSTPAITAPAITGGNYTVPLQLPPQVIQHGLQGASHFPAPPVMMGGMHPPAPAYSQSPGLAALPAPPNANMFFPGQGAY